MGAMPTGTVTFLFTDIEGSTRLWRDRPSEMEAELAAHDELSRAAIGAHDGYVFATGGDGFAAAFARAGDAVAAADRLQTDLSSRSFLKVRMGLHTGEAQERDGDYFGTAVNRAARLMAAGHGGQVLVSEVTAQLIETPVTDLGEHQLRDLAGAQRVFQLGDGSFAPLRSLDRTLTNLPNQATSLIGRRQLMDEIAQSLVEAQLVTLIGVGGVGKTRLAIETGAQVLPKYPDGVWFADLATSQTDELALATTASALEVTAQPGESLMATIPAALRNRRLLLILDNCEHVAGVMARLIEQILAASADVRIVVTSREPLGLPAEHLRSVPALGSQDDAVELFVERARQARADFFVDDDERAVVVDICRRLDGVPLAIELAAARTRAMAPAEIADRLDERFRLLTGGARTAMERHRTLAATVAWSYDSLDDLDRRIFDRLSVFAGTFDLGAAEAVVADGDVETYEVLDALLRLVDKSMVVAQSDGGGTRYRLLETLRQYAEDRLTDTDDATVVRDRFCQYWVEVARRFPYGSDADLVARMDRIESELENFRAALFYLVMAGAALPAARAVLALGTFWEYRHGVEGLRWAQTLLDGDFDLPDRIRSRLAGHGAMAAANLGDARASIELGLRAVELAEGAGEEPTWSALWALSYSAVLQGDDAEAARWNDYNESISETRQNPYLMHLAGGQWAQMAAPRSAEWFDEQCRAVLTIGDPLLIATTHLAAAAAIMNRDGDPEAGLIYVDPVMGTVDDSPIVDAGLHLVRGELQVRAGHHRVGADDIATAIAVANPLGYGHVVAQAAMTAARLAVATGRLHEAALLVGACDAAGERLGIVGQRNHRLSHEMARAAVAEAGGHDEALAAGRAMSAPELVQLALGVAAATTA